MCKTKSCRKHNRNFKTPPRPRFDARCCAVLPVSRSRRGEAEGSAYACLICETISTIVTALTCAETDTTITCKSKFAIICRKLRLIISGQDSSVAV